jgi:hypothetical protein
MSVEGRGGFAHRVGKWKADIIAIRVPLIVVNCCVDEVQIS